MIALGAAVGNVLTAALSVYGLRDRARNERVESVEMRLARHESRVLRLEELLANCEKERDRLKQAEMEYRDEVFQLRRKIARLTEGGS